MQDVKFLGFALSLVLLLGTTATATDLLDARPDLGTQLQNTPVEAKKMYRETWNIDNKTDLTAIDQLEYIQKHNPGIDADTMALVYRGTELLKTMKFGTEGKDLSEMAPEIQKNPVEAMLNMTQQMSTTATEMDMLSALDTMEPSKRLEEKMYDGKPIGQTGQMIDINSF